MNKSISIGLLLTAGWLTTVAPINAQQKKLIRIGILVVGPASAVSTRLEAFRRGLRDLGYVEGKNIELEYRYGEGKLERISELAAELVRLKVNVIVTAGSQATRPAKEATHTIPIVMANAAGSPSSELVSPVWPT